MFDFAMRMEKIRKTSVEKTMSINIDMRAYKAIWVAEVAGIQVCQSGSFLEVIEAVERMLGIEPSTKMLDEKELQFTHSAHLASRWKFVKDRAINYGTVASFQFDDNNKMSIVIKNRAGDRIVNTFEGESEADVIAKAVEHFTR